VIATSINMHVKTYAVLERAAVKLHTSRREVVVRALMRIMSKVDTFQGWFTSVKYQPDDAGLKWRCFPIKLKPDEYEFFTDLRKVCKCSVSLLVAIALEKYLDEVLDESRDGVYNNTLFKNYLIRRMYISGVVCWMLCWGYPKEGDLPLLE
jgi:hypothetical protein